jgi:hypothetical protein
VHRPGDITAYAPISRADTRLVAARLGVDRPGGSNRDHPSARPPGIHAMEPWVGRFEQPGSEWWIGAHHLPTSIETTVDDAAEPRGEPFDSAARSQLSDLVAIELFQKTIDH